MSYGIRKTFYQGKLWRRITKEVWLKQNCLCSICHRPVYVSGITNFIPKENRLTGIVHHKTHLDDINVYEDDVAINFDNLTGVCKDCHENLHHQDQVTRPEYEFDEDGNLISR